MNPEETLKKWLKWVEEIRDETEDMLASQHIYKTYIEIVKNNPKIQSPSDFHDWARRNYATAVVMYIRRQLDASSDSVSLKTLLLELEKNPQFLTKQWHRKLYKILGDDYADQDFKKIVGNGDYFNPEVARKDMQKLEEIGSHIQLFATRRFAHKSVRLIVKEPTYNDLDKFLKEFEEIVIKYILLFTASGHESLTPTWQYYWTEIFTHKWIDS